MPEDIQVWDRIAAVREAVFKLQQLHGVEIEVFSAPWIEPFDKDDHDIISSSEVTPPFSSPADLFWDKREKEDDDEET
jgi:hypothetical protein